MTKHSLVLKLVDYTFSFLEVDQTWKKYNMKNIRSKTLWITRNYTKIKVQNICCTLVWCLARQKRKQFLYKRYFFHSHGNFIFCRFRHRSKYYMWLQTRPISSQRPQKNLRFLLSLNGWLRCKGLLLFHPMGCWFYTFVLMSILWNQKNHVGQYVSVPPSIFYGGRKTLHQACYPIHYELDKIILFAMF